MDRWKGGNGKEIYERKEENIERDGEKEGLEEENDKCERRKGGWREGRVRER